MAVKKISELPVLATIAAGDQLVVSDVSDADPAVRTKSATVTVLLLPAQSVANAAQATANAAIPTATKDATGGVAGLTLFKINFRNALNTFTSFFTNANTAARTYTFQNKSGTIADTADIAAAVAALYPVGCIYTTTVSTNPATVFGFGTWAAFGAGRTLVGLDAGQTEFDTVEETGGAKTHTLAATEMPAHVHGISGIQLDLQNGASHFDALSSPVNQLTTTMSAGGGLAHNNLQPYIVVYFWKRTA
jgi:hypothetical protein